MKYEIPQALSHESAEQIASGSDPEAITEAVVALAVADAELAWTASFLLRMTKHAAPGVRGAALVGLGHLSRRFRKFPDAAAVAAAIKTGLNDKDAWVRGQADAAAADFDLFIGKR